MVHPPSATCTSELTNHTVTVTDTFLGVHKVHDRHFLGEAEAEWHIEG